MSQLELTILGSNSALPVPGRFPTAQVLNICGEHVLIDCGEGTQLRMSENKIKRFKINHVFISHLHGDHVFGLPGLLTSYSLLGRQHKLCIYGPKGIKNLIQTVLSYSGAHLTYDLDMLELDIDDNTPVATLKNVDVYAFPLSHRIATYGYRFQQRHPKRKLIKDKIQNLNIKPLEIKALQDGQDVELASGRKLSAEEMTHGPALPISYSYCSDTVYSESIVDWIYGTQMLYHEATYLDSESHLATERMHSTAKEAARIAQLAGVQKLVLGHFSSRYEDLSLFQDEAKEVFSNVVVGSSGSRINL